MRPQHARAPIRHPTFLLDWNLALRHVAPDLFVNVLTSGQITPIASDLMDFGRKPPVPVQPGSHQESVWAYPRPPALLASQLLVEVSLGGVLIAESTRTLRVLETSHPPTFYLPPSDVNTSLLLRTRHTSFCEWKGIATYWDVTTGHHTVRNGSWSYQTPSKSFAELGDYFSFYPSLFECFVDGDLVQPQPGDFYGGWVTKDVVGPFKGQPGSEWW